MYYFSVSYEGEGETNNVDWKSVLKVYVMETVSIDYK